MTQVNNALIQPLLGVALFEGLREDQIGAIARGAERIVYRSGEKIVTAHAEGDAAVLLVSGDAYCTYGTDLEGAGEVELVVAGSLVGEMAMLVEIEHAATVVARGQVRALRITRDGLRRQMEQDPSLADHFLHKIAGRLSDLAGELRRVDQALLGPGELNAQRQQSNLH